MGQAVMRPATPEGMDHLTGLGAGADRITPQILKRFGRHVAEILGVPHVVEAPDEPWQTDTLQEAVRSLSIDVQDANALHRQLERLPGMVERSAALIVDVRRTATLDDPDKLARLTEALGLQPTFTGLAGAADDRRLVAIFDTVGRPDTTPPPESFRVLAIIRTYNEADIIGHTIRALLDDGIEVHIIDGWSTDRTADIAEAGSGGRVAVERFPPEGPSPFHDQVAVLHRIELLAEGRPGWWILHHDADERRQSPWPGVSLRAGLHAVTRTGFDAIDHTVIEFDPIGGDLDARVDYAAQLDRWRFTLRPGHFNQRRAWRQGRHRVDLASSAGHRVEFPGVRPYPFKFLLRHYPFRTEAQLHAKIKIDRRPRVSPLDRARGWAAHYDAGSPAGAVEGPGIPYDETSFFRDYLVERLSGIGVYRQVYGNTGPRTRWEIEVNAMPASGVRLEIRPVRDPTPDPAQPEQGCVAIDWDAGDGSGGCLFVSRGGAPEQRVASGSIRHEDAPWISPNVLYRFRLYSDADRSSLRAEATVRCLQNVS